MTDTVDIPPIVLEVATSADPETAWRTLTEPARVVLWFTDATPLGPVGAPYRLDFGDGSMVVGEVVALEPGRRFAHTWTWEGSEPGETTVVTWSVEPAEGGGTRIVLRHEGWTEAGGNLAARDDHEGYWSGYLDDLLDVLEEA